MPGDSITQRNSDRIELSLTLEEQFPIHYAGAALAIQNPGTVDRILYLWDSDDGTTWNVLPFSTLTNAGEIAITIATQGYAMILFTTAKKYVRITLDDHAPDGIFVQMFEFVPRPRDVSTY